MVPKLMKTDFAKWMKTVPGLEKVDEKYICEIPACSSYPCLNGAICTETLTGYECNCTSEFYGPTCACPIIYTPDGGETKNFAFPDLIITQGMTSFEFEIRSSGGEVFIRMFRSIGEAYTFEIEIARQKIPSGSEKKIRISYVVCIANFTEVIQEPSRHARSGLF
ncbi:uncharacterized protein LOC121421283 [Lytechinus variegatus]|uniref:uncharacterized protein LOC121421283 n=1 Tax=Lytechinus variegatus TaxID=7654 RepID=UPI001BB2BB16|nr:uncharacterized protein LOC121421283 [Lytechinus variegatus]